MAGLRTRVEALQTRFLLLLLFRIWGKIKHNISSPPAVFAASLWSLALKTRKFSLLNIAEEMTRPQRQNDDFLGGFLKSFFSFSEAALCFPF